MIYRRLSVISILIIFLLVLGLMTPGSGWNSVRPAQGATLTVNSNGDSGSGCPASCSLRGAINSAASGDTIVFASSVTGVITFGSTITINKNLTINGPGASILAISGGGTTSLFTISSATVTITGLTLRNAVASASNSHGGAIFNGGTLTLSLCVLSGNSVGPGSYGGAIYIVAGATLYVSYSTISGNVAGSSGSNGGGIYNSGTLSVDSSVISNNTATASGGGIYTSQTGTTTVTNSTISGNAANGVSGGGGIYNRHTLVVNISAISGNTTALAGGGIAAAQGTATITSSTISGNRADGTSGGGGIFNSSVLTINNSTIASNTSTNSGSGGGGIGAAAGYTVNMRSTIVALNSGMYGPDINGTITSQGYNLISNTAFVSGLGGTDQKNVNPLLGSLATNSPGTTQTMALQTGSPAIGQGNCTLSPAVTTDQRGVARKGPCDVGAYEWQVLQNPNSSTIGMYVPSAAGFYLRYSNDTGPADNIFGYGPPNSTWLAVAGDWTGGGIKTIGIYDPSGSYFALRNSNDSGNADENVVFGTGGQGWLPIVGDWIGQGKSTVGVYDPSTGTFYLRNSNTTGGADIVFQFGPGGQGLLPIVGDWTNQGKETIGLYSPANAYFYLRNSNSAGNADIVFQYGPANVGTPITGRWNGTGPTTIGIYVASDTFFYLRNSNSAGNSDETFQYGAVNQGWQPMTGRWH